MYALFNRVAAFKKIKQRHNDTKRVTNIVVRGSVIVLVVTVRDKLIRQIVAGRSDSNIQFEPLCHMLRSLGFHERIRGDHHIFGKPGIVEIINLQPLPDGKAKAYQVKQVRNLIVRYKLVDENDGS